MVRYKEIKSDKMIACIMVVTLPSYHFHFIYLTFPDK